MADTIKALAHPKMADPSVLARIAERLQRELGAEAVIVYGSVARGEATADSDIDLFVIAPSGEPRLQRTLGASAAIRDLDPAGLISPLVLTPEEVRRRLEADDRFIRLIIDTGIELSGDGRPDREPNTGPEQDARSKWGRIRPMPGARPSESWRRNARQDWHRLSVLLDDDDGPGAGIFLQQTLEKFLKGWLLEQGWELRKTHALPELLDTACTHEPTLIAFRPFCERVSKYFLAGRYPDAEPEAPDAEQVRGDLGEAALLVRALFSDERLS